MNTIIKSTIILALATVFFLGFAGVTFAGHNTIIPEGAKVYENAPGDAVLDDFGSIGTTFTDGSAMGAESLKEAVDPVSSSWY